MAKVKVTIEAKASGGAPWWISIDDLDLVFANGKATAEIEEKSEHVLFYWVRGDVGTKVEFSVTQDDSVVLKGSDTIPKGYGQVGSVRRFKTF